MLKFGSPSITLSLLVQNCTVKVGFTVFMIDYHSLNCINFFCIFELAKLS